MMSEAIGWRAGDAITIAAIVIESSDDGEAWHRICTTLGDFARLADGQLARAEFFKALQDAPDETLLTDEAVSVLTSEPRRTLRASTIRAKRSKGAGVKVTRLVPWTPRTRLGDLRAWIAVRAGGTP